MFSGKTAYFLAILISTAFLFNSCITSNSGFSKKSSQEDNRPVWIDSYPVESEYFIGIGSSKTGNKSQDLDTAKAKALAALASAISVNIKSSQDFTVKEDSDGKSFQSAEVQINQSVSRNFSDVEVYDSWYSDSSGYWFYYRISKSRWEEIQRLEKAEISLRVNGVVAPVFLSPDISDFEILSSLGKGWQLVAESPYEGTINTEINGKSGILIDLLEENVSQVLSGITLQIEPEVIVTEPGRLEDVRLKVIDKNRRTPGTFKIDFINKADGAKVADVRTDKDGNFSGKIGFNQLPSGKNNLSAVISMQSAGINPDGFRKKLSVPQKELSVEMNQVSVILKLVIIGNAEIESLQDSVKALFSRKELALRLSPGTGDEKNSILFTMFFRNLPENTHGLYITNAKASISLIKDGSNIYSYETKEYKEAGLTWDQAQERAVLKLFRDINNDDIFITGLHKAVYSGLSLD
ncbi:MAG: LPP20 family lipoprotein [Spirochaetia bacterium]|jgi:hypothetical protein|nr:LPP20 family lipoprotein [Spirochaetia bacterium]